MWKTITTKSGSTYEALLCLTTGDLKLAVDYMKDCSRLAIDTETTWNGATDREDGALRHDNLLLGISISKDETSGLFIPYCVNHTGKLFFGVETSKKIALLFRKLFTSDIKWIFHNSFFDIRTLERAIGTRPKIIHDTLVMAHELDENRKLGLKDLGVSEFGDNAKEEKDAMLPYFKAAGYSSIKMGKLEVIPLEVYGMYAIKDTLLTMKLFNKYAPQLKKEGMLDRYKFRQECIEVFHELNTTGWTIDEGVLNANGKVIRSTIELLYKTAYACLAEHTKVVEEEILEKTSPLTASPSWKKKIIEKESLQGFFTVPSHKTKRDGTKVENKDGGKLCTNKKYTENFLKSEYSDGTITAEILQWNGDLATLSEEAELMMKSIRRETFLRKKSKAEEEASKIPTRTVFSITSTKQVQNLLHEVLKLDVIKRTGKTNSPDMSSEILSRLQRRLMDEVIPQKYIDMLSVKDIEIEDFNNIIDRVMLDCGCSAINGTYKRHKVATVTKDQFNKIRAVLYLECLVHVRDRSKLYSTYVIGLRKHLYSAADLKRKPQYAADTGNELKYLLCNNNMTGTATNRPSFNSPNLGNITNDPLIKEAFSIPRGYKLVSVDFAAQEVRETGNITLDPALKELFTVKCQSCNVVQPDHIGRAISLDLFHDLKPIEDDYTFCKIRKHRGYMAQVLSEWKEPNVLTTFTNKKGKEDHTYTTASDSIKCECGEYNWSEPDPHSLTAKRVYPECANLSLSEIKKQYGSTLRQDSKIIQFLILYGGTEFTLAEGLYKSTDKKYVKMAKKIIDDYMDASPYLKSAIAKLIAEGRRDGYITTVGGYRRHLPDLAANAGRKPEYPRLDPLTKALECFGKVDLDWTDDQLVSQRLSYGVCSRLGKCKYYGQCKATFKFKNTDKLRKRSERQTFNAKIQGSSADHMNRGLLNFYNKRKELAKSNLLWNDVHVVGDIYDAAYIIAKDEIVMDVYHVLKDCLENTYTGQLINHLVDLEMPAQRWSEVH